MKIARVCALLMMVLLAGACWAQLGKDNAVWQADVAFAKATHEKGLEGWVSFFSEKAVLSQFDPPLRGTSGVREGFRKLFALRDLDFTWHPLRAEILPQGNLGYTTGRATRSWTDDQGKRLTSTGNYITIWQKQSDGSWKVIADFGSLDPAAARN